MQKLYLEGLPRRRKPCLCPPLSGERFHQPIYTHQSAYPVGTVVGQTATALVELKRLPCLPISPFGLLGKCVNNMDTFEFRTLLIRLHHIIGLDGITSGTRMS